MDRLARLLISIVLLVWGYRNRSRTVGTLAFVAGADLLATTVIRRCPMNAIFGIDTCGSTD